MGRDYNAMRETKEQWDDLPPDAKVVGKRRAPRGGHGLQRLANEMGQGLVTWPKGVFRFRSHEEADAWWIDQMQVPKQPDCRCVKRQGGESPPDSDGSCAVD